MTRNEKVKLEGIASRMLSETLDHIEDINDVMFSELSRDRLKTWALITLAIDKAEIEEPKKPCTEEYWN